ncbi:MAG: DJ-1/PfpI family protein [Deltaproteobacteria bacterium]|nr:DJ-1/PfpI family protein [Deltaproteobacteria bacterium]
MLLDRDVPPTGGDLADWVRSVRPRGGEEDHVEAKSRTLGILLYPDFELLDVFGPVEMFAYVGDELTLVSVAAEAGPVRSAQGQSSLADHGFADCPALDLLLVPGGIGTIPALEDETLLAWLRERAASAEITTSVCSGSAILARAGLLDGRRATSNKQFFELATSQSDKVDWVWEARWVDDGDFVTSSGVSAGMDMALAVIERLWGRERADEIAALTEYERQRDPTADAFAKRLRSTPSA